ncbi:recombinase family protein [Acinetobacter radioresistens]|jgi:DNA invertase Pin-like site-specific DNA recombinase|uniref:Resolvase, N-terminal domain protein n=5 Tax=Acinetobacter radioresistens TaxID=40216 RepID=A0ABM9YRK7_ACIRA|nr:MULTISPECIES: recombinase family protein [Acinetobacter]HEP0080736.1 recombinase family protein [Klebsiella pneumoniae subsp. pneumoniae]EET83769.1 resolvase, N-terminal domain protein [Acinetobacter radioresistens SK82]EEY85359.1 putative DNA-invertase hin [Acinetobacter radioresistens SH164]EXB77775.1 resolvase, N terminal domain protein [Acinetobacter sp. 272263]MCK4079163.1 recombinase family protein [Acinetobacter radioresistens]
MSKVAYKRVSTADQNTARQLDSMTFDKVFEDKISGKDVNRPALQAMLEYVRDGDELYVHSLDRLGRNTADLIELVNKLKDKGVTIIFEKQGLKFKPDTSNPMNDLMFTMLAAFAQFERELLLERQREGIAKAKEEGKYRGRIKKIDVDEIRTAMKKEGASFRKVAKELGISLSTVQRAMKP